MRPASAADVGRCRHDSIILRTLALCLLSAASAAGLLACDPQAFPACSFLKEATYAAREGSMAMSVQVLWRLLPFPCRHNVTPPSSGLVPQAPVWSGWCPRVSRPDFIFEVRGAGKEEMRRSAHGVRFLQQAGHVSIDVPR